MKTPKRIQFLLLCILPYMTVEKIANSNNKIHYVEVCFQAIPYAEEAPK